MDHAMEKFEKAIKERTEQVIEKGKRRAV